MKSPRRSFFLPRPQLVLVGLSAFFVLLSLSRLSLSTFSFLPPQKFYKQDDFQKISTSKSPLNVHDVVENTWRDESDTGVLGLNSYDQSAKVMSIETSINPWTDEEVKSKLNDTSDFSAFINLRLIELVEERLYKKKRKYSAIAMAKEGDPSFYYQKKATGLRKGGVSVLKKVQLTQSHWQNDIKNRFSSYQERFQVYMCLGRGYCWDKKLYAKFEKSESFFRTNRVIGFSELWANKQGFCLTLREALSHAGSASGLAWMKKISFPCWRLPEDMEKMKSHIETVKAEDAKWIIKPAGSSGGNGITVKEGSGNMLRFLGRTKPKEPLVVQPFLNNPLLHNDHKFDLRVHVLVTSVFPLRAYVHSMGAVRFAYEKYDRSAKNGGKRASFLTNISVNHKLAKTDDITWTFQQLRKDLANQTRPEGLALDVVIFSRIDDVIAKLLVSSESAFRAFFDKRVENGFRCSQCYQTLGIDILLDAEMQPHVVEVNTNPTMNFKSAKIDAGCSKFHNDVGVMLFSKGTQKKKLESKLEIIRTSDPTFWGDFSWLTPAEIEYLLNIEAEQEQMGSFRMAYPPARCSISDIEASGWLEYLQHIKASSSRIRFHKLLVALQHQRIYNCKHNKEECSQEVEELIL